MDNQTVHPGGAISGVPNNREYSAQLLHNDMDATKHTCLFYLAGMIGTGAQLEDFFYLMCKTLDYDRNKVLFYYSNYMAVTRGDLFKDAPYVLTDETYEQWICDRKNSCVSTRTSTCTNLCRRKAYQKYDIPAFACSMCKLSHTYQNSRDLLERKVIRYFMEASTPQSRIFINNAGVGFVSVERISPRTNSFGRFPVIRFYNLVYDFLFNDPRASELRKDHSAFSEAAALYICNQVDLSGYDSSVIDQSTAISKLLVLLNLLWKTDISDMISDDDGSHFADICIRMMHQPYTPFYEGKQTNPHPVTAGTKREVSTRKRSASGLSASAPQMDLLRLAEGLAASVPDQDCSLASDVAGIDLVGNSLISDEPMDEKGSLSSQAEVEDTAEQVTATGGELPFVDQVNFMNTDYVPFQYDCESSMGESENRESKTDHVTDDSGSLASDMAISVECDDDISGTVALSAPVDTPSSETEVYRECPVNSDCKKLLPALFPFRPQPGLPVYVRMSTDEEVRDCKEHGAVQISPVLLSYMRDYLPGVSPVYRYCICIPSGLLASRGYSTGSAFIRVTDESMWDFMHSCAISDYALLSPAASSGSDEGLLLFLSGSMRFYYFNLAVRGADNLDSILINSRTKLFTADTLGCINMFVKYGSAIATSGLISMDLYYMYRDNLCSRDEVYELGGFKTIYRSSGLHGLVLAIYQSFLESVTRNGVYDAFLADINRLQSAYRILLHQSYLPPVLADAAPIAAFTDDLHVRFLFRDGYRFSRRGTVYTIRFRQNVRISSDLTKDSLLPDILGLFDLMTHRYFHITRLIYCDDDSVSVFLESGGSDAAIFYDLFYHGIESCLLNHGHQITDTVTVRMEYR